MRPAVTIALGTDNPFDMLGAIKEAIRPAAQAGAQVFYEDVKKNVARLGTRTGNLGRSIYQVYSKDSSGPLRATYQVSWNHAKAPHGHLIEYGHIQKYHVVFDKKRGKFFTIKKQKLAAPKQVPAHPFMRPAWGKMPQAEAAIKSELAKKL